MKKLKVYQWTGWREECPPAPNSNKQTREIVAATSWLVAEDAYGRRIPRNFRSETGNAEEIAKAMSKPFTVFWRPLDARRGTWTEARAAMPRAGEATK